MDVLALGMTLSETSFGEWGETWLQAAVPGSSLPSGQSQKSSLTCEGESLIEGLKMQEKLLVSL